jgi:Ricin-type beta-trefoil lectin domain-like
MIQLNLPSFHTSTSSRLSTASVSNTAAPPAARYGMALILACALAACVAPPGEADPLVPEATATTETEGTAVQEISANSCAHPQCVTGPALAPTCDPVVATVCNSDPFCCGTGGGSWDHFCVDELASHEPPGTCSGSFMITTRLAITECIDILGPVPAPGTPLIEGFCTGLPNQRFALLDRNGGFYNIVNQLSGECVSVSNGSQSPGAGIIEYPCKDLPEQKFLLTNMGAGDFTLRPSHSGQCVDIPGSTVIPGTPLIQWPCTGGANELFHIE